MVQDKEQEQDQETINKQQSSNGKLFKGHSLVLEFSDDDASDSGSDNNSDLSRDEDESDVDTDNEYEEDLMYYERAVREIAKGDSYQCMICTVEMDHTCKMYACRHCYRVFDYDCIREWALKSTQKTVDKTWKCPNCYHSSKKVPLKDRPTCWCGKVVNPDPNPLDPNSCGQTCNANICPHKCLKQCHLGSHPECTQLLKITCRCGRETKDIYCHESRRQKSIFHCDQECGLTLPCGIHKCRRKCHSGLCGSCPELLIDENVSGKIKCYCGLHSLKEMNCKDVAFPSSGKISRNQEDKEWVGIFDCKEMRSVSYTCNEHVFVEGCIAPPTLPSTVVCPFSPNLLKTCPCGKTALQDMDCERTKCTDPIPTCDNVCNKILKCGKHRCPFTCHTGKCMDPCIQIDKMDCACERRTFLVPCQFKGKPVCKFKCESLMSCRRHRCMEYCCSGRPYAERRKKTILRSSDRNDETLVEAEHVCLKDCNLKLSCGIHTCQRKCHPGPCPPCLESDSNDLVCPCGKTVIPAPVRCGTTLPPCKYPCIKVIRGESDCGHKPMPHSCHSLDQPCPVCTAPVFKPCKCGKKDKVRTMCFQEDVSCGLPCGLPLKDCYHKCQKRCHLPGECQNTCIQICNAKRSNCSHGCTQRCHKNAPCPDIPCTVPVTVVCDCGRRKLVKPCSSTSTIDSVTITSHLECDEECMLLLRRMELKAAFGIVNGLGDDKTSVAIERIQNRISVAKAYEELELPFVEAVLTVYAKQPKWCSQIEGILNKFMDEKLKSSLHFKHMKAPQRSFVHNLADAYKIYSESQDPEPVRSVFVKKLTNGTSSKPILTLEEALPLYESFKEVQKEKKKQEYEARTHKTLINVEAETQTQQSATKYNGFLIKNLVKGTTEEDLERIFGESLKPTLVKDPQYLVMDESHHGFICPADYAEISINVERDMEQLIGFFDSLCKEHFIGDIVELCNIDEALLQENVDLEDSEEEKLTSPEVENDSDIHDSPKN
ncbi:hypothetical protein TBLA_0B05950 [Henningerozyma blattae CBS 6284]|uniref:R3H domain-containing protein n=1 Tax=Henningerozyma blattae (strain ATCC 34711 / CBS 6284 / DSM 70876 / NBRC 10599 / NRRL Y-10934 / UCD 77-7) TaxID=1071380 RepID=I2GZ69_HENB6|nr:hypothetical protein TBLA_0B05950 [Tetrapisispora blattae CBS 6284]CCH59421.1 hypothetical protein TBLA_0B05950 [Tetrapisispora blattae CBS 6284]